MKIYILICLSCLPFFVFSQAECRDPTALDTIFPNGVKTLLTSGGDMFHDGSNNKEGYFVYDSFDSMFIQTLFVSALLMGGLDENEEIRVAWQSYGRFDGSIDYSSGLLKPSSGTIEPISCANWDKVWSVKREDIEQHLQEITVGGTPQVQRKSLYDYPALGNPYFFAYNGFNLPFGQYLAPFYDANGDAIYNPDNGDYPLPEGVDRDAIPTEMYWSVFNDVGHSHRESRSEPLGAEVQLTTFAYACERMPVLHQTLFTQYKIINQTTTTIDSFSVGNWWDFELGCWEDDYMGASLDLNTVYTYNQDGEDGPIDGYSCIEGGVPVQAITYLNQPLKATLLYHTNGQVIPPVGRTQPHGKEEMYHGLNGKWKTGVPVAYGGHGYYPESDNIADILYPDNPNDPDGWSMLTHPVTYDEGTQGIMSTYIGDWQPGHIVRFDQAWSYHRGEGFNFLENVDLMYEQVPMIQVMYDNKFADIPCVSTSIKELDNQLVVNIFPNPTTQFFQLEAPTQRMEEVQVFDVQGRLLKHYFPNDFKMEIDIGKQFLGQLLFVKIRVGEEWIVRKVAVY